MYPMPIIKPFRAAFLLAGLMLTAGVHADPLPTISWEKAREYVNQEVEVTGLVVRTNRTAQGTVFLNFARDYRGTLSIHIPPAATAKFTEPPEQAFKNKLIRVRGRITLFKGDPSLTVNDPAQIAVGEGTSPERSTTTAPQTAPAADCGHPICPEEYLPTISAAHAPHFLEQQVLLIGTVTGGTRLRSGHVVLDMSQPPDKPVKLFIRAQYVPNFPQDPVVTCKGKTLKVRGRLYLYEDRPNISVTNPGQISILPDDFQPPPQPIVPVDVKPTMTAVPTEAITIATFNVENLFDAYDDPYSDDDVRDAKPRARLELVAATLRQLDADVVALAEVENRFYLEIFLKTLLPDMGYEAVAFEGNDGRGIDVAVLSRLPVGPVTSHRHLRFQDANGQNIRFRRDFLQVRIEPPGGLSFDIFAVHFKSKGGKEDGGLETRLGEATAARAILDKIMGTKADAQFVVCGDFNDFIDSEPLKVLLGSGPAGLVHFVHEVPPDQRVTYNQEPYRSMIDFILASPAMARRYMPGSYRILPGGPDINGSDHNPVVARFRLN